jgi:hypothetical protein
MNTETTLEMPVIYSYSRAQALEDGVLVDVSGEAAAMGYMYPTAITAALFAELEEIPPGSGHDARGRLHDVLWMGRSAIKRAAQDTDRVEVTLFLDGRMEDLTALLIHVGGGDDAEPVLTIGFPNDF